MWCYTHYMSDAVRPEKTIFIDTTDWCCDVDKVLDRTLFSWRDEPPELPTQSTSSKSEYSFQSQMHSFRDAVFADSIFKTLLQSSSFLALLSECDDLKRVPLYFTDQENSAGSYIHNDKEGEIDVNHKTRKRFGDNPNVFIGTAAHEMRHAWQKSVGVFDDKKVLGLEDTILLAQAYERDAVSFQATVCWELKKLGNSAPWDFFVEHSSYKNCAVDFEQAIKGRKKSFKNGAAQNIVQESWLQNQYVINYYKNNIYKRFAENSIPAGEQNFELLNQKIEILNHMPYLNKEGDLKQRKQYKFPEHAPTLSFFG